MSENMMLTIAILARKIVFISPAADEQSELTVGIKFLSFGEQTLIEPITRPAEAGKSVITDAGKTFAFSIDRNIMASLAKRFVMTVSLHQTDPAKKLSDTSIDVTRKFRAAIDESEGEASATQGKTTVEFFDEAGVSIAHLDLVVRLTVGGTTTVRSFLIGNSQDDVNIQYMSGTYAHRLPVPPEFRCPRKALGPDDGEWDIVCAELDNGQKIAVKYRRNYCQFKATTGDDPCPPRQDGRRLSKADRNRESYLLKMMEQMHRAVVSKRAAK